MATPLEETATPGRARAGASEAVAGVDRPIGVRVEVEPCVRREGPSPDGAALSAGAPDGEADLRVGLEIPV